MQALEQKLEVIYYKDKKNNVVRTSNELDVEAMKGRLRKSDIKEVWASHHHTPGEALRLSYELSSLCLTIEIEGIPGAMFGLVPQTLLSDSATIWLLSTDAVYSVSKLFLKECRRFIQIMLKEYSLLENYVDARNTVSIRWLKWCGATIEEAHLYGVEQLPFHRFEFRRVDA